MSDVWNTLIEIKKHFEAAFDATGTITAEPGLDRFDRPGWANLAWTGDLYRRAHISIVDCRTDKGVWMMHSCVFPHTTNPAPIFGFDVIAGKSKITGCFYDYSPAGDINHPMITHFTNEVSNLSWNKTRNLPEWAERIFSPAMVATANVNDFKELEQIVIMACSGLDYYLQFINDSANSAENTAEAQNHYLRNQKLNPHTPRVMSSLGLSQEDVQVFIEDCLFPEIR